MVKTESIIVWCAKLKKAVEDVSRVECPSPCFDEGSDVCEHLTHVRAGGG